MTPVTPTENKPLTSEPATPTPVAASTDSATLVKHNLISLSAAGLIASFFLPWVNFLGAKLSGLDIQRNFSSYQFVWLMPVLALLVLILNMLNHPTGFIRRVAGLCPFAVLIYAFNRLGSDLLQGIQVGGWLALGAGAALVVLPSDQKTESPS